MTRLIRYILLELLILLARSTQRLRQAGIPVFVYHSIDNSGTSISLTPKVFEQQLNYLRRRSFHLISATKALALSQKRDKLDKCVVLTFDDAYTTIEDWINNLLEQKETATVFVPSGLMGLSNRWDIDNQNIAQINIMSSTCLQTLHKNGCELGGHTHTHKNLTAVSEEEGHQELVLGRTELAQQFNDIPDIIAYPYGAYNDQVLNTAKRVGYVAGFTTQLGYLTPQSDPLAIPRFPTNIDFQIFRLIVHGGYGWYRKMQDWIYG